MSTVKKIGKNMSFLYAGNIVQKILSLVMIIYIAQKLGVENFGIYSFVFSFVVFSNIICDLGVTTYIFRETAKDRSKAPKLLGTAISVKLILFFLSLIIISFSAFLVHSFDPVKYSSQIVFFIFLAGLSLLLDSLAGTFKTIFFSFQEMQYEFYVGTFYKALLVVLTLGILFLGFGITEVFLIALFSSLVNFFVSVVVVTKKFVKPIIKFNFNEYKSLILSSLPFGFVITFFMIYSSIDSVMLSLFKGNLSVGYYSAAMRLIFALGFIPVTFMSAIFPVMASFYASANKNLNTVVLKSLKYLLIIVLPIAFSVTLLSGRIIQLIYPTTELINFAPAADALVILIWFSVLNFLSLVFLNLLQSTAFEKKTLLILIISVVANILFNLLLIPLYDFRGAAFASVLSEFIFFALALYLASKYFFNLIHFFKILVKPFLAGIFLFVFIYFFFFLNIIVLICTSFFLYFVVLFLIGGFDKKDLSFFKKIFPRINKRF